MRDGNVRRPSGNLLTSLALGLFGLLAAVTGNAAGDPQRTLAVVVDAYTSLAPIGAATGLDDGQAQEVQRMVVLSLRPRWGEVVGYKAALTSPAARQRFGIEEPVLGVLMENMFTTTGSTIDLDSGVRLVLEADLMVRIGSDAINGATTEIEALAALDEVIPYVEIPDLMFAPDVELTAADVVAINAGARIGVVGTPVSVAELPNREDALSSIAVTVIDADGNTRIAGDGSMLLGNPLRAVLWIRDRLAQRGIALKSGDLLSLGSMGPPLILDRGLARVTATYDGLGDRSNKIHIGFR